MTIFTEEVIDQINEFIRSEVLEIDSYDIRKAPRFAELTSDDSITRIEIVDELDQLDEDEVTNRMLSLLGDCIVYHTFEMYLHIVLQVNSNELQVEAWLVNGVCPGLGRNIDETLIVDGEFCELDELFDDEYDGDEEGDDDYYEALEEYREQLREMYPDAEDIDFSHTRETYVIKLK